MKRFFVFDTHIYNLVSLIENELVHVPKITNQQWGRILFPGGLTERTIFFNGMIEAKPIEVTTNALFRLRDNFRIKKYNETVSALVATFPEAEKQALKDMLAPPTPDEYSVNL